MLLEDKLYKVWVEVEASGLDPDTGRVEYEQHIAEPIDACEGITDYDDAVFLQVLMSEIGGVLQDNVSYLRKSHCCPQCGCDEVDGGFVEVNDGGAYQKVSCAECNARWEDHYALTGCRILEEGNGPK